MIRLRPTHVCTLALISSLLAPLPGCSRSALSAGEDGDALCEEVRALRGPARGEALAFARLLKLRPSMAIDFSEASGEYCLNTGAHVMTHFSIRPEESSEDVIYFVDAAPLVARGLRLNEFPHIDPDHGTMRSNVWYRYEGQGTEPHHGRQMADRSWLMLAVDIQ
jgi:hypothetical protein